MANRYRSDTDTDTAGLASLLLHYMGGVRSKVQPAGGGAGPAGWGSGQRSIQLVGSGPVGGGGQVQLAGGGGVSGPAGGGRLGPAGGGQVQPAGGSASCALLRVVCLLRSRRRTFLFYSASIVVGLGFDKSSEGDLGIIILKHFFSLHRHHK